MPWKRSWYNTWKVSGKGKHVVIPVLKPLAKLDYTTWNHFLASYMENCPTLIEDVFVKFGRHSAKGLWQSNLTEDLINMLTVWDFDHDPDKIRKYTRRNVSIEAA